MLRRIRRGGALVNHVHIPAGRGPVVLAGRRRVSASAWRIKCSMVRVQYGPRRHGGGWLWRCHGRRRGRRRVRSPVYSSGQVFAQAGSVVDFFCLEFF